MNRRGLLLAALIAAFHVGGAARGDFVIGAFDASRSSRPFSGSDYSNIRADLSNPANFGPGGIVNQTVTFAPEISTATPAALGGTNLFVITEVDAGLSSSEVTALTNFVLGGGCLVLVTDSAPPSTNAVNQMLGALDGGSAGGFSGGTGANVGSIVGDGTAVSGPFGHILGGTFGATPGATLNPGSASTVIGTNSGANQILEIAPGALGPGSGGVLATGDVLFMNFFVPPATLAGNVNNAILFENFVAGQAGAGSVPEPSAMVLAGLGLVAVVGYTRRKVPSA